MTEYIESTHTQQGARLLLKGEWRTEALPNIEREAKEALRGVAFGAYTLDASGLTGLDTAGAWMIERLRGEHTVTGLSPEHHAMLTLMQRGKSEAPPRKKRPGIIPGLLMRIGEGTVSAWNMAIALVVFIGETSYALGGCLLHPKRIRTSSIVRHVDETGIDAIPIIALIAFLISVVLAYQGAEQLKRFGADIFTVNLVSVSVLREMGVLLTAIMVAGRSGSAFTAEIGVMKVNEEVDAMRVIGMNPFDVLVLPRLMALAITLPILTFLADVMGLLGGGVICYAQLGIPPEQYIEQLHRVLRVGDFWVGIVKAPVFAFLIAVVGCMRGMQVSGSAESVGRLTTVSVVHSIFLVLLADALFSILFTKLGL